MNIKSVVTTLAAIVLTSGGLAFAQGNSDRNDRDRNDRGRDAQSQRDSQSNRQSDRRDSSDRRRNDRDYQGRSYRDDRRDGRGAGPNHSFYRGGRLPAQYRHRNYVVNDWRGHRLTAPPRGHHWVQTGGDYVLVAIATGVIVQLLLN